ncbi:MAG: TIR domain-containing protein [Leptolyngbya sp. UWPOB_LEPTO1]|uniref:TIR domain-containing protein n=1 Tax=Leptolyngbya sp. UWPOB_LEPTO1 TaxID=2815653 RepID=UPI001AC9C88E|nr:TIR domain-containing protein [Leptolyngbya sp. UWPOB_LEPTO1]MBN8560294.1 TIR domain-containing protein [Leptolyngbya sp. UWPOB_LEPTO1]
MFENGGRMLEERSRCSDLDARGSKHGERSCNFRLHQIKIYPRTVKCPFLPVLDRTLEPIKIFVSYARRDQELCAELITRLKSLKSRGWIEDWHDGQIVAGSEWEKEIKKQLNASRIILLLISDDFIASDYCYYKELMPALERHDRKEAYVIPVILRPSDWEDTPFGKLQALPEDALPITKWGNRDDAFLSVARGIRRTVEQLRQEHQQKLEQIEQERQQQDQRRIQQIWEEQERQRQAERERLKQQEEQRRLEQMREEKHQARPESLQNRNLQTVVQTSRPTGLPWKLLCLVVLCCSLFKFALAISSNQVQSLSWVMGAFAAIVVWTWTIFVASRGGEAVAVVMARVWTVVGIAICTSTIIFTIRNGGKINPSDLISVASAWVSPVCGAWSWALIELLNSSFRKIHAILILSFSSAIGLALGALMSRIIHL